MSQRTVKELLQVGFPSQYSTMGSSYQCSWYLANNFIQKRM